MKHPKGFSLVELPIVFSAFGFLAAILVPAVHNAMRSANMVQTVSNGHSIYQAAFADQMDFFATAPDAGLDDNQWPKEGDFASSTAYFVNLVTNDVMCVSYDFFAAEGIPPAKSCNPADFKAENNAWKLVFGLDGARDGTPFIFTRNYAISTVPTGEGPILPEQLMDNNGKPFGTAGLVVIQKGGAGLRLQKNSLREELFNPAGAPPDGRVLAVLDP